MNAEWQVAVLIAVPSFVMSVVFLLLLWMERGE